MAKQIGSQNRETLKEAETVLIRSVGNEILTLNHQGQFELWMIHDHHAGYTLEWDGVGYEFLRTLSPNQAYVWVNLSR